jgi:hypothetical protein
MTPRELTEPVLQARALLDRLHVESPSEILVEEMACSQGAMVVWKPLKGADGRLLRLGRRAVIRVRDDIPELGRRRFVIAHELGHLLLAHRTDLLKVCDERDLLEWGKAQRWAENDANEFAAELLMPERFFRPRCQIGDPSLAVIEQLAGEFQTSLTATAVRYVEGSSDRCAIVVSRDGQIRWNRCSESFPYWCLRRGPLHGYTFAIDSLDAKPVPDRMSQVGATGWLPGLKRHADRFIWEQSRVISRQFRVVLSLLWLPEEDG